MQKLFLICSLFTFLNGNAQKNVGTYSSETVLINGKYWMKKNLNVSKFNNGDDIRKVDNYQEWQTACERKEPIWMYYKNNASNGFKYGKIYNFYALIDKRGLAPIGFHIPSKNDFESLKTNECVKLKSTEEWYVKIYRCKKLQNINRIDQNGLPYLDLDYVETNCQEGQYGNNSTGFNALPCGCINKYGPSESTGLDVGFWSSTTVEKNEFSNSNNLQYSFKMNWSDNFPIIQKVENFEGYYVRCVKDNEFLKTFFIPKKIELPKLSDRDNLERIYPIGWSREGKFAFIAQDPLSESSIDRINFYIQDMVTNKTIYSLTSKDINTELTEINVVDLGWDELKIQIAEKLNENNIEQLENFQIMPLPIVKKEKRIGLNINNKKKPINNIYGGMYGNLCIFESSLQIKINNQISTTIFSEKYQEKYSPMINNKVVGCFKSPYEDRVAFIYLTEHSGYHGSTDCYFKLIGYDLTHF